MQAGTDPTAARRTALWAQLVLGWLPAWALFALLLAMTHEIPWPQATAYAGRLVLIAGLLGLLVVRGAARWPWPHPWRWRFLLAHALAAPAYSLLWLAFNSLVESALRGKLVLIRGPGFTPFFVTGIWLYVMVAGVAYAQQAARAAAEAQALQARTRLAALRTQLHPHFLFNALHTVVQLIPMDPAAATRATEQLAAMMRLTLDQERDLVSLREEWSLVQRYLELEQLRLGERLVLQVSLSDAALGAELPGFALQTLVENSIRHAAERRVQPTRLEIAAWLEGQALLLTVHDDGPGCDLAAVHDPAAPGTGLRRLRERLAGLCGDAATLNLHTAPGSGFKATLRVPQDAGPEASS